MEFKSLTDKDAIRKISLKAMKELESLVGVTLGPGGLPVLIERHGQALDGKPLAPMITKDGVTVAQNISHKDSEMDLIIQTVKNIASKTNRAAGDGPQPLTSKVLTPTGFTTMGSLKKGDVICGTNKTTQTVLEIYPKGPKEVLELKTKDGRVVECCNEHTWTVQDCKGKSKDITTGALMEAMSKGDEFYIPTTAVEYEENTTEMPLDAYLVGVLLSGAIPASLNRIGLALPAKNSNIIARLKFPKGIELSSDSKLIAKGITSKGKTLKDLADSIGLESMHLYNDKIPKSYLYASFKSRLALYEGIMELRGGIFKTRSKTLAEDFLELSRSLNIKSEISLSESYSNGLSAPIPRYEVKECLDKSLCSAIASIKSTGRVVEMQCIKVSNKDHLYITNDHTLTHNTTTATVLGHSILKEFLKVLSKDSKMNPQSIRLSIESAVESIKDNLRSEAKAVTGFSDIKDVATISSNGESGIGEVIAQAFEEVGNEGVITIDEGSSPETTLEIVDGFQFGRGAQAQNRFFNDENNTKWEAEEVRILIYNGKLNAYQELIPAFELLLKGNNNKSLPPLLIIADEFSQQVIQFLLIQRAEMGATICAVRSPSMTITRTNMMEDIAVVVGGERLGVGTRSIDNIDVDDIGIAKKVIVTGVSTTIYDGYGAEEEVIKRVSQLKVQRESAPSEFDKSNISDRIAALAQGIAKIGVGGRTEVEMKERYHRIEDALNAARASVKGGIIPGGGSALYREALYLSEKSDKTIGELILSKALTAPINRIISNTGRDPKKTAELLEVGTNSTLAYDATTHVVVDAFEEGIVDPVNVTISALENATSIATLLATCGGGITIQRPAFLNKSIFEKVKEYVVEHRVSILGSLVVYYIINSIL